MIAPAHEDDLTRWLDQATRGLPLEAASSIRAEITAHVEDAVADMIQEGMSPKTAFRQALDALGDPHTVGRGLSDVHRGQRLYFLGMILSVAVLVVLFGFPQLHLALNIADYSLADRLFYIINDGVSVGLMTYVVIALRGLLIWRFDNSAVDRPSKLVLGGFATYFIGNVILELTVDSWSPSPTLFTAANALEGIGVLIMHSGMLTIGVGLLLLGLGALSTPNRLVKSVAVISSLMGVVFLMAVALLYINRPLSYIFYAGILLIHMFLWPVASLLFMQALYFFRPRLPTQTA